MIDPNAFARVGRRRELAVHPKFGIYADEVAIPGEPASREYLVVEPRGGSSGITGVAVIPTREDRVGLIRMYRHAIRGESWEIPRGFLDDEPIATAARRELEEETGLSCAADKLVHLAIVSPDTGIFAARVAVLAALDCTEVRRFEPQEFGHEAFAWFDAEAFDAGVADGRIHDSYTLVAYYRLAAAIR
jgi:ADP-ribose pyrophosphatase